MPTGPIWPNTAGGTIGGGGRASARETAARVAGGAVAQAVLAPVGVTVAAYTVEFGGIPPGSSIRMARPTGRFARPTRR